MQLIPLYEKIIVLVKSKQEVKSAGGIVIQQDMSLKGNNTMIGYVTAVGEGRVLQDGTILPMKVKVGDTVVFTKMSGEDYNDGDNDYKILSESQVLAIIKGEK